MTLYDVRLSASGDATVTVDAPDADTAATLALTRTNGMIVEGGECDWNIEDVREVER